MGLGGAGGFDGVLLDLKKAISFRDVSCDLLFETTGSRRL